MLKLKLQYFGHLTWRANPLDKTLMLGKTEGKRRRELQRMRWLDRIINSIDMNLTNPRKQWRTEESVTLESIWLQSAGHDLATQQQQATGRICLRRLCDLASTKDGLFWRDLLVLSHPAACLTPYSSACTPSNSAMQIHSYFYMLCLQQKEDNLSTLLILSVCTSPSVNCLFFSGFSRRRRNIVPSS